MAWWTCRMCNRPVLWNGHIYVHEYAEVDAQHAVPSVRDVPQKGWE
jgi:hypothetical protein